MNKIIDYKIVHDHDLANLTTKVKEAIKEGWQPTGAASYGDIYDQSSYGYVQAWIQPLVKYEK